MNKYFKFTTFSAIITLLVMIFSNVQPAVSMASKGTEPVRRVPDTIVLQVREGVSLDVDLYGSPGHKYTTNSTRLDATLSTLGVKGLKPVFHSNGAKRNANAASLDRTYLVTLSPGTDTDGAISSFSRLAEVALVEPDYYMQIDVLPAYTPVPAAVNDPRYSEQWALPAISATTAWDRMPADAPKVTVAVIDTGICASHPDLDGRVLSGWDFVQNDAFPLDENGHGCFVSGIIAANTNNGIGISGLASNAQIMPLRALDASGSGTYTDVAAAIVYAADNGARIVNLSLGGPGSSATLASAVNYAVSKGVILVAAAGNDGMLGVSYPAAYPQVVAVGSIDSDLQPSYFSNYGPQIDIWAPGSAILSLRLDGTYGTGSGTSFAAPYVAGAQAIYLQLNETLPQNGGLLNFNPVASPTPTPGMTPTPTATPVPGLGDLAVTNINIINSTFLTNDDVWLLVDVTNISDTAVSGFDVDHYVDDTPTGCADSGLGTARISSLAPNETASLSVRLPAGSLAPGTHQFRVFADSNCEVTEGNETNNVSAPVSFTLTDPALGPPSNDDFDHARAVSPIPFQDILDVSNATTAADDPSVADCNGYGVAPGNVSVWYTYTPDASTHLIMDTYGSEYDTYIAAWSGTRGDLNLIACNDDMGGTYQSELEVGLNAGTTYYIEVAEFSAYLDGYSAGDIKKGLNQKTVNPAGAGGLLNFNVTQPADFTDDPYEENDSRETAHDLSATRGAWLSDLLGYGIQNDNDWYKIHVTSGSERILVDLRFTHNEGDIDLSLFDADGNMLDYSNSITDNEYIDYEVPAGGDYYLKVYYDNAGNQYDLWWDAVQASQTLMVSQIGTGSGSITSNPAGIYCGATCSHAFEYNSTVTLNAWTSPDSIFMGWSGGGCSGTGTCVVTMDSARSVSAAFSLRSYSLTVNKTGAGAGLVTSSPDGINCGETCNITFYINNFVTLSAVPAAGSYFAGWTGEGCSGTGTCSVWMGADRTVTATFEPLLVVRSIARTSANPSNLASVKYLLTFSESVTGVDKTDFLLVPTGWVTGYSITGVTGSGATRSITVTTGSGSGTLQLKLVDDDSIRNPVLSPLAGTGVGNGNFDGDPYTLDKTPPAVVSILRADPDPSSAASLRYAVTFSESVTGVDKTDFGLNVSGLTGAAISAVSGSGMAYTVSVLPGTGAGSLQLKLTDNDSIKDVLLNPLGGTGTGTAVSGETYSVNRVPPTVLSIARAGPDPVMTSTSKFTVTFSEPVTGVDIGDFSPVPVTGAFTSIKVSSVIGSGTTYTLTVISGPGSGSLRVDLLDNDTIKNSYSAQLGGAGSGNGNFTSGETYSANKTFPAVVSITRTSAVSTNAVRVKFTVTFSEPMTGVDPTDFQLYAGGTLTGAAVSGVTGGGSTWLVTAATGTGSGTLRLDVLDNDSILDASLTPLGGPGAANGGFTAGESYTLDRIQPAVTSILRVDDNPTSASSVNFNVTFSEDVSGVDKTDFRIVSTGLVSPLVTNVSGSGSTYIVTVGTGTATAPGTLRLDLITNNSIKDAALNLLGGSFTSGESYTFDKAPVVLSILRASLDPTPAASVKFTVKFSESVTGVDKADFGLFTTLTGTSILSISGSGSTYTVLVGTGTGSGSLRLDLIDNDSIMDLTGKPLGGAGSVNGDFTTGQVYSVR